MASTYSVGSVQLAQGNSKCEKLGFTGLQVCSDCESMAEYVKDEELLADCKQCCVKDTQSNAKYASAVLEVCPYRLNVGLPHIQDFISKHAARYKSQLKVERRVNAYPKIILSNGTGDRTSVRIDNWRVATIHDFLADKLQQLAKTKK
ncbi:hypothetical protein COO60DRAFT_1583288 [Scenedesmus sp. NREL 46B-D3]|nr:hypothetical protein COO60DRAFT_1583288 [Scenedesmus sp. NREL 46B-D3]